ncbi:MAG: alkaline phosphatase family protein [Solirubrobacteraceae bacterium]
MTRSRSVPALLLVLAALAALPAAAHAAGKRGPVTASGWRVTPAGKQFGISKHATGFQGPLASALTPGSTRLLSVSSGASRTNTADLFDLRRRRRSPYTPSDARRGVGEAVFYGVAMSPDGTKAWASGGGQDVVHAYSVGRQLREVATVPVPSFPAGIAYGRTPRGDRLYVANNLSGRAGDTNPPGHTVTVIDPATNGVTSVIDLGVAAQPFGVAFERHGAKAYVTQWMGRSVSIVDTAAEVVKRELLLSPLSNPLQADHPSAIAANPKRDEVYTANANSDTVSVIDTITDRVERTIDVSLVHDAREGATPNGLAVSPDGKRLYVALAGENALAMIDVARRRVLGFIPTAWSPVDVDIAADGSKLVVTGQNRVGDKPNRCAGPYAVGDCSSGDLIYADTAATSTQTMTKGVINVITAPRTTRALRRHTAQVLANNRVRARLAPAPKALRAIKHVIYVIKENRTYDQVLGDLGKGDGDPSLTLFREDSSPNHHELARRFTLFDNFYADADVSADGQSWATAAGVTDYTNKTWPISYSPAPRKAHRARDFEDLSMAEVLLTEPLALDRTVFRTAAATTRGFLWDNAYDNGVSFRNYGIYTKIPGDCQGGTNTSTTTRLDDSRFGDHVNEYFAGFNMSCSDHAHRLPEWERDFRAYEQLYAADPKTDPLPQLTFVRLPNDHTYGTGAGRAIPQAYMADNDLALGRLVDVVSHSRFWKSTAIFVTEDDAQNGPDHIDAHRTLAYVISPYSQAGAIDSTQYDTAGMVATMEDLLGLPPMAITDQRAIRMWKGFTAKPNLTPYDARMPSVVPFGLPDAQRNAPTAPMATVSGRWNFEIEDATPEIGLNEAIWKSVHGRRSEMPAPRHDRIVGSQPAEDR